MKPAKVTAFVIGLMLILVDCSIGPPFDVQTTIKMAKAAAAKVQSPPRLFSDQPAPLLQLWPDAPGSKLSMYNGCDDYSCFPQITYTLTLVPDERAQLVIFGFTWQYISGGTGNHEWEFHVDDDGWVQFLGESGSGLLKTPSGPLRWPPQPLDSMSKQV